MRVTRSPAELVLMTPRCMPSLRNCHCAAVRVVDAATTRASSSASVKWAP